MTESNQGDEQGAGGGTTAEREYVQPGEGWVKEQLEKIDAAGDTSVVQVADRPIVVVTVRGKSGRYRRVPVMRVEHDGRYAVVASKGGAPKHPVWYHSIAANPDVEIQDGSGQPRPFVARELPPGPERDEWWRIAVDAYPPYADYQTKTDRLIPVFVCEPKEEA